MSGRWGLAAGAALLLAANVLVLAGVARNRAAPPESQLVLSERELALDTLGRGDDTGRSLRIVLEFEAPDGRERGVPWLDRAKLASLGFDVRADPHPAAPRPTSVYHLAPPRPALLVLELDGPAYRREQARAAAKRAGTLDSAEPYRDLTSSRLFAVDAGLDAAELRRRYPDRARYAIAAGEVVLGQPMPEYGMPAPLRGWVRGPRIDKIDVPLPLRRPFERLAAAQRRRLGKNGLSAPPPFHATIAWGRRLEPWIVDLTPLPAAPAHTTPPAPPTAR